jgi:hypothetical protein
MKMDFSVRTVLILQNSQMASVACVPDAFKYEDNNGSALMKVTICAGKKIIHVSSDDSPELKPDGTSLILKVGNSNHKIDCKSIGGASATREYLINVFTDLFQECERKQRKLNAQREKSGW